MKKFASMFMAIVMAFTMGPNVMVRAQDNVCEGESCQVNDDGLTGWAWCTENPKDCATYLGETALKKTKLFGERAWDVTKPVCDKVWEDTAWVRGKIADGAVAARDAVKNYNYTQLGENIKWCTNSPGDCATSVRDGTKAWFGDRVDELAAFKGALQSFCDDKLKDQAQWPFWSMVAVATWPITKTVGNVAMKTVKIGGKVVLSFVRFAMNLFCPCYRGFE